MYIIKKKTVNVWHYYNNITGWNGLVDNATRYKYLSDAERICEGVRMYRISEDAEAVPVSDFNMNSNDL